jgi:hypothetical protein
MSDQRRMIVRAVLVFWAAQIQAALIALVNA